jgi:hypothetical protein
VPQNARGSVRTLVRLVVLSKQLRYEFAPAPHSDLVEDGFQKILDRIFWSLSAQAANRFRAGTSDSTGVTMTGADRYEVAALDIESALTAF